MERLRKPTTAMADESARGLFARACGLHKIPNSWTILKHVGVIHRNRVLISEDDTIDLPKLELLTKVAPGDFVARRYPQVGPRRRSFFGLEVYEKSIESRVRRFSPAALAETSHMRAMWELRDLPYSTEGWDMLQTRCRCGIVQGWTRMTKVDRCDSCGRRLADVVVPIPVPIELRPALELPALLASPLASDHEKGLAMLPAEIASTDRRKIYQAMMRLRLALQPSEGKAGHQDLGAIHAAAEAIIRWPRGLAEIPLPAHLSEKGWTERHADYRRLGEQRNRFAQRRKNAFDETSLLGAKSAYYLTNIWKGTLFRFREEGALGQHVRPHGTRMVPAFERKELLDFAARYRGRMPLQGVATKLGITLHGAEQLVALGRLSATAPRLKDEEPFYCEADLDVIKSAIDQSVRQSMAKGRPVCPVPLREVVQGIGGRAKPWGTIIAAMMDGDFSISLATGDQPLVRRIAVEASEVDALRKLEFDARMHPEATFSNRMFKRDALETLNMAGMTPILDGLAFTAAKHKAYDFREVITLAEATITTLEVARRMGAPTIKAYHAMTFAEVPCYGQGRWDRIVAEKMLF